MAIGDIVGTLSVPGSSWAAFTLVHNPGGLFALSGAVMSQAINVPVGTYPLTIKAQFDGLSVVQSVILTHAVVNPSVFQLTVNLSGLQDVFPVAPSSAQIGWYAGKNIRRFRLPIGWSEFNGVFNLNVGIQPVAFGPLDTTSTYSGPGGYCALLDGVMNSIAAAGCTAILDIHTFGAGPNGPIAFSGGTSIAAFADLITKVCQRYLAHPAFGGLDPMNEWSNGFDSTLVLSAQQAAVTAARNAGFTGRIYVEGTNFSGVWNWVSGQGQAFNNANLYQIVDPLNNRSSSGHGYFDYNGSGGNFSIALEAAKPGVSPPGTTASTNIGPLREAAFLAWCNQYSQTPHHGEFGITSDNLQFGGNDNFAAGLAQGKAFLDLAQANNMEVAIWGGGDFGTNYAYGLEPSSTSNPAAKDYTTAGLQPMQWALLDRYTGYSGPQPIAYRIDLPVTIFPTPASSPPVIKGTVATFASLPGSGNTPGDYWQTLDTGIMWVYTASSGFVNAQAPVITPQPWGTVGVASGNFTIRYGGKITSPVTITPYAHYMDGTSAGGTFTPASIVLPPGDNAIAYFTYTPAVAATLMIGATNNAGWIDPPALGFSAVADGYYNLPVRPSNVYGLYNRFTPNIAPAFRLQRRFDNAQMDIYFNSGIGYYNNFGSLDRQTIQNWAGSRLIPLVTRYDTSGAGNTMTFSGAVLPVLNLQNSAGYPEIVYASGCKGEFNTPLPGQTQFSTIIRMNQTAGAGVGLYRMDWDTGPILVTTSGFQIFSTGYGSDGLFPATDGSPAQGAVNTILSMGIVNGAYHDYGASYASGVTNGFVTYKDSVQQASATVTYKFTTDHKNGSLEFVHYKFGNNVWFGSETNTEIFEGLALSSTQTGNIMGFDATYYSTPLPDSLTAVNPEVIGAAPSIVIISSTPFAGVTIQDTNSGSPTDRITITLSGTAGGTLAGTGISGTGPYTISAGTPAAVTATLRGAVYTTSGTAGQTETFSIAVTSSAGTSITDTRSVVTVQAVAPPETPYPAPSGTFTPINLKGVNIPEAAQHYPAASAFNYIYPENVEIDYWAGKGMGLIRMALIQLRLQPVSFGPLDPANRTDEPANGYRTFPAGSQTNLLSIKAVLDHAFSKNMYVVFDLHNGGGLTDTQNNIFRTPGTDTVFNAILADWWTRIATVFKNYPNAIWGLFNEPESGTAAQWQTAASGAATAIAAVTTSQKILFQGVSFDKADSWTSSGNSTAWASYTPPAGIGKLMEMHNYLNAADNGFTADVVLGRGSNVLDYPTGGLATTWARANGWTCYLGETGWSASDTIVPPGTGVPSTEGGAIMHYMSTNNDVWKGWSFWVGGGRVFENSWNNSPPPVFSAVPEGYPSGPFTDAPQTSILVANL